MAIKNEFTIEVLGDVDYEGMIIMVNYGTRNIAEINYENGIDKLEIKLTKCPSEVSFPLDVFFDILEKAKEIAKKCAKEDAENPPL